ncbi:MULTISPECIES: GNAT family N-acetyltransferase [unclassified Inquilinus]|uniref:GNAT family N-acetyltransferase n=1 Tax=unclassified Inquilinus TaxID=2645927 RepID=UPI003F90DF43
MTLALRPLVPADHDRLLAMAVAFHDEDNHPLSPGGGRAIAEIAAGTRFATGWMIEAGGDPIGYLVVTWSWSIEFGGRDAFIDDLYIEPAHRGRGHGGAVLEILAELLRAEAVHAVHLEVEAGNPGAARLYRRHGFAGTDRTILSRRF